MTLKPKWTSESVGEYEKSLKPSEPPKPLQRPVAKPHKWVGLDNDDLVWIYSNSDTIGQAIGNTESKLKEKNT